MAGTRERLSLVEYGAPVDLAKLVSQATGFDRPRSSQLLADAGIRVASSLGFGSNPISIDARGVRALDFAGLIRLSPALELEVSPKFLGDAHTNWREDFFFLSTLSKHGRLLATERLSAAGGAPRDLATLVARSLTGMYEARKRRPLRSYRRVKEVDFFIDDDPDPVDLRFPGPDGFELEVLRFDRRNPWNAAMREAAKELLSEVGDPDASAALVRMVEDLAPQHWNSSPTRKRIPSRHRTWTPVHELSLDVLAGLGINYKLGRAHAPGYVVSTWQLWEDLLTLAARLGYGQAAVRAQKGVKLGTRHFPSGSSKDVSVYPDLVIDVGGGAARFVLDAKYKGHIEKNYLATKEADIYEGLAFAKATRCAVVVLAYPASPLLPVAAPGSCSTFETVFVDQVRIVSVQVEMRGISRPGALIQFSKNLRASLTLATQ